MDARGRGPIVDGPGGLGVRFAADVFKFAIGDVEMAWVFEIWWRACAESHSKPSKTRETSFKSADEVGGQMGADSLDRPRIGSDGPERPR